MTRLSAIAGAGTAAALLVLTAAPAGANDTTAALTNSGLVLTTNSAIEMRSEALSISETAVKVRYAFVNTAPKDVTVTVAFPIPDIVFDGPDVTLNIPKDAANFLGFRTTVNGAPVNAQLEQKAVQKGVDVTAYLRGLGVPIQPYLEATDTAINRLTKAQQDDMVKRGLAMNLNDPGDATRQMIGLWTLKSTFFWNQTFPAGKTVTVEHDYTPSVGSTAGFPVAPADMMSSLAKYCVDADFVASASKTMKAGDTQPNLQEEWIDYVLTTGANWKAPIGDFTMTIDKGAAANLVSFCGTGVVKTGPTTFQVHYTNFTPKTDVAVLLAKPG